MKKISYLELSAILLTIISYFNTSINIHILKETSLTNAWIAIIIAYLIGIIPLLLTISIANYKPNLNLFEKNKILFGNTFGNFINILISIVFLIIAITILNNISNFITTQFLYHTKKTVTIVLLVILAIYCSTKEINVITHTSIILINLNLALFIISNLSLIDNMKLDNLLPILPLRTDNLIATAIKIATINILPIIIITIIPKDKITNQNKYNKALIITYFIGCIIALITTISTISTLGVYLTKLYEYPEYTVLKTIKLFGFLERTENIISISWIIEAYIYITFIIYTISKNISKKNSQTFIHTNITVGSIIITLTIYLFKNIAYFNYFIKNQFIIITSLLLIIYLIITAKILLTKNVKSKNKLKDNLHINKK